MDNCIAIAGALLSRLNIPYTKKFLKESILSHPDYPSLKCISDTLDHYNLETLAIKIDQDRLQEVPLPCIIQYAKKVDAFFLLESYTESNVVCLDDKRVKHAIPKSEFLKHWTGICLLVESTEDSKEPGIEKSKIDKFIIRVSVSLIVLILLFALTKSIYSSDLILSDILFKISYFILKVLGSLLGLILLWHEVDRNNLTLQKFCTTGKKTNCNKVLDSKHATILKGRISVALLGFTYFFAGLFSIVILGFSGLSIFALLSYLSLGALMVVPISVYYQDVVIRHWCKLCILLICTIILEVLVVLLSGFYRESIFLDQIYLLIVLLLFPLPIWKWLKPLINQTKESYFLKRNFTRLKNDSDVFSVLLRKSRKIRSNSEGMGIILPNENAKYHIIKVTDPNCSHCTKSHLILDELYRNKTISLQILFRTNSKEAGKNRIEQHFLALHAEESLENVLSALHDWYSRENRNYDAFIKQYPLKGKGILNGGRDKLNALHHWCEAENITATPTIFINGYELPKEYSVTDLKRTLI